MLAASAAIERALYRVSMAAGWLFVVCTVVIVFDVLTRKFGYQLPGMGSTRLQELEWHLHTALFSFWLGTAYLKNAHVRIDILVAGAPARRRAWIEFLGVVVFALPYCLVAIYFSYDFFHTAWQFNEYSDSATGLPWRWIPKGIISIGLILLLAAVLAIGMRLVATLWSPKARA
ncbi:MAG TPA: TRAP transporter small permease subunit [Burkholderiales bacterium]|nr:TRAP transporter small permease subunit [Burkholderiales bacterium]